MGHWCSCYSPPEGVVLVLLVAVVEHSRSLLLQEKVVLFVVALGDSLPRYHSKNCLVLYYSSSDDEGDGDVGGWEPWRTEGPLSSKQSDSLDQSKEGPRETKPP